MYDRMVWEMVCYKLQFINILGFEIFLALKAKEIKVIGPLQGLKLVGRSKCTFLLAHIRSRQ